MCFSDVSSVLRPYKTHSVACEFLNEWLLSASVTPSVCLFVWFTGVTPAEPRCVMVLNMVPFIATQTH